ncbi:MAG: SLC45 family MFS transporter [Chloroflexi bacterium]|nr:SLC45 family MFS transporter [Chloroflexota bacterium]
MEREIRWYDYITINIYYFALTARSQTLALIVPLILIKFVDESVKGAALGNLRLWGLMTAVLIQALIGFVSDHSPSRYGRRRPFILIGGVSEVLIYILIGVIAATMEGMTGYGFLFVAYILSMLSANTGHGALQGLIPDLVPEEKHGIFAGVKAVFELPAPMIFVSFVIAKQIGNGNFWPAIITLSAVVLLCVAITMFVSEKSIKKPAIKMDWQPILRLAFMTAAFTAVILGAGALVKFVNRLAEGLPTASALIATAAIAVLGMVIAVILGVWLSVKISLGGNGAEVDKSFTWWVINRLSFLVGTTNLSVFAVFYLQERFAALENVTIESMFGQMMMYVGLAIFVSSIPAGWVSDKIGQKPVCAISGVLALLGTIIVIASPSTTVLYIGGMLIGLATGLFYSASWALGTGLVPKEEAGRYLGIHNLAGAGAGAIGAYIGGPIGDGIGFTALMGIFGLLFLISTLALFGIRVKTPQPAEELPQAG